MAAQRQITPLFGVLTPDYPWEDQLTMKLHEGP